MLSVKTNLFCGISERASWKQWLRNTAPDLYNKLIETQRQTSCRKNTAMMKEIRTDLYNRGLGNQFETFIRVNFPTIIETEEVVVAQNHDSQTAKPIVNPPAAPKIALAAAINKHGVFKNYRAGLLTFPHRRIFVNPNKNHLEAIVKSFLKDKIGSDYLIIEDHAYVEYFNPVYSDQAEKIKKESRDIYQFRLKNANR